MGGNRLWCILTIFEKWEEIVPTAFLPFLNGNISSNLSLDRCQKHPKKIVDSGSWSIYNGKKLYPDIHILATALCNRHSKLFQSCQITVAHTKCLVHTCQKNCHKLYFRAQIK